MTAASVLTPKIFEWVDLFAVDRSLRDTDDTVRDIYRYVEQSAPWTLHKNGEHEAFRRVVYTSSEALRLIPVLLHPVMPRKAAELCGQVGWTPDGNLSNRLE